MIRMALLCVLLVAIPLVAHLAAAETGYGSRPNVVLIMTDDQGYGDLGHTGNKFIKTPHLDILAGESISLTDYHVAPTCSPTRCSILSGHWTNRAGAWHTINGRSMLRENEVTIAAALKEYGYTTGMFGKWHLGDNYPYRAEDRGFMEVMRHGGGGVGQTPDLWDNAYFDGSYFHNSKITPVKGFCTDVFFEYANAFITKCAKEKKPFFAYIAPNAPHGPLHAPQKYMDMYSDQNNGIAAFYGMITNIDDNVGKTRALLQELGVADNTIFIFTTDNGTASGEKVFNAGMRGKKGSEYEGGHRVPFMLHWPAAKINTKRSIDHLTHTVDVMPTILSLTGAPTPQKVKFDGVSLEPLIRDGNAAWPDRMVISDSQRVVNPVKWKNCAVMSEQWRLINGKELYDIKADPGQKNDVAKDRPDQVAAMRAFYEAWWAELEPTFALTTEIYVGHPEHPQVILTAHDWIGGGVVPWNQNHIRTAAGYNKGGQKGDNKKSKHGGHWAIKVITAGTYAISLRRWPVESDKKITEALPPGENVPGASRAFRATDGISIPVQSAVLRIDGEEKGTMPVPSDAKEVTFTATLSEGSHQLSPVFVAAEGEVGAYYVVVTKQ